MKMQLRELGRDGPLVSAIGLGCMGMAGSYGRVDLADARRTIDKALELGVTLFDTADVYGAGENEKFVGQALAGRMSTALVATKFGMVQQPDGTISVDGRPEYVRKACEASLARLKVDCIDLFYQHRIDPMVPIEETVGAMSDLVREGKIRYLGLSEAGAVSIGRAHKVHPISAVQVEYSLWTRETGEKILPTLGNLGISLIAYSPLGRGFFAGRIDDSSRLTEHDRRMVHPRFQPANFDMNLELLKPVDSLAASKGCDRAQIALAWTLSKANSIIPIPGTTSAAHLVSNIRALNVELSKDEISCLESQLASLDVHGDRYPAAMMSDLMQ